MRLRRMAAGLLSLALLALALTACADDDDTSGAAEQGAESFSFGRPGDPTEATRTIDVDLLDHPHRYEPAAVRVKAGETVRFRLLNKGTELHEFLLGDAEMQQFHRQMSEDMEHVGMGDDVNLRSLEKGDEKFLTWTFPDDKGTVFYGCHVAGHYEEGMKGTVTLT